MNLPTFDAAFIKNWEDEYYQCAGALQDEREYQSILIAVQNETSQLHGIAAHTLRRILKWKDSRERVIRSVDWGRYDTIYAPRFRLIISGSISDHHKLFILIWDKSKLSSRLPVPPGTLSDVCGRASGFGVPVASTVLHFIMPDRFPIIDIRTAETLYLAGKIRSPDRGDYRIYDLFRSVTLGIAARTGRSLHEIDRALFAYHRDIVVPQMHVVYRKWIAATVSAAPPNLTMEEDPKVRRMLLDSL